ncbi:glycan biosynthesis hexose transferase WsfD [Kineothrix sp. MB12-C1]|uniref:glycan biosynthesis hexose transferase WsfD n=1 Tax=Kineothrix sp. MB12-C1 TaxID=3070215 RepID=UPI0027D2CA6C|nr:DUF2334 domain-containing protein [Kineothrix sp. MB12-C1]WMC93728.1 DUF2334 domain-containing protein [Kineothrix sp. MB12-C1]
MKKAGHFLRRTILSPPVVAAIMSTAIMIMVLMIHPLIGMADNGDFYRTISGQGIYKLDRYEDDQYLNYFSSKFGLYQNYNENEDNMFSSQNLYIQTAVFLNNLFSSDNGIFDIRFLSVFLLVELVIGIAMLIDYISYRKSLFQGMLLAVIGVVMFADTAYTAYFNSFYAEGLVYVSTLILIASALLMTQKRYSPLLLFLSVLVNSIILIFTKQQNATEGLPLFILFICMVFFLPKERTLLRKFVAGGAVLAAICGIVMYLIIPESFVWINQYHAMARGVLMTAENPEEALDEFGIDRQYSILDSSIYYERYPAVEVESQQFIDDFYSKYGFISVSIYYVTHPNELIMMLDKAVTNGYMIRPAVQGNYEREAGRSPGEQTQFFTLYSDLKKQLVPNTIGFVLIWFLVACGISFRDKKKLQIILCTMLMGVIQIGTSIVGAGDADLAKHIFMYNVSFDLISYICFAPLFASFTANLFKGIINFIRKRRRQTVVTALFLLILSSFSLPVRAAEENENNMLIIGKNGEDLSVETGLARAYGMQVTVLAESSYTKDSLKDADYVIATTAKPYEDILAAGIPAICMGAEFTEVPESELTRYRRKGVRFSYDGYEGEKTFLDEFSALTATTGKKSGTLLIGEDIEVPFAVQATDGNFYVPVYDNNNAVSKILLGSLLKRQMGIKENGKTYFMLDEVYFFSDLNKLCVWADKLNNNGIPFLVSVMPIYDNLDYPAFLRFAQVLRYMQSRGGTILIHEPLLLEDEMEREPIADKMLRFQNALTEEQIYFRAIDNTPYQFSMKELEQITSENKYFGELPFDTMFGVTADLTEEEFDLCLDKLNQKWLSFTDLQKEYSDVRDLYFEKEIPEDFVYREKEEVAFELFFNASDRFLLVVVGASVLVLGIFLMIGRKWYRRKFFR